MKYNAVKHSIYRLMENCFRSSCDSMGPNLNNLSYMYNFVQAKPIIIIIEQKQFLHSKNLL